MDGAEVGVLEETNEVGLGSFLEGHDGRRLETEISLEVLGDLTDKTLEGELADEKLGALLVPTDLTESHGTGPVPMGFLDSSCGRSRFASSLGGELLAWGLATGGLACCLLSTSHDAVVIPGDLFLESFIVLVGQPHTRIGQCRLTNGNP